MTTNPWVHAKAGNGRLIWTPQEMVWRGVRLDHATGCWEWQGLVDQKGYGLLSTKRRWPFERRAHRHSYETFAGPIPAGLFVLHRCDNPRCCNPEHLFLGTNADNMRDRSDKQRQLRGETCPTRILTEDQVREIRRRAATGKETHRTIAADYGVHRSTVTLVCSRRGWVHVE